MKVWWLLSFLVLKSLVLNASGLRCRLCQRARSREDCQGFQECADDESCFLDEIITNLAETVYVGGCRAKNVCAQSSGSVGKRFNQERAVGDFVACSRCCTDNYCNEKLCGLAMGTNLLHCYACGAHDGVNAVPPVRYPEDCAHERVCQHNQLCFASTQMFNGVQLEHTTKCMEKTICHKLMNATFAIADVIGKRYTTPICAACCGENYCNQYACETVKRRLLNLRADGFLDYENLKEDIFLGK